MQSRPIDAPRNKGLFLRIKAQSKTGTLLAMAAARAEKPNKLFFSRAKKESLRQAGRPVNHQHRARRLELYQKALAKLPRAVGHRPKLPFISGCSSAHTTSVNQHHHDQRAPTEEMKQILAERDDLARTHGELRRHILSSKEQRFDQQKDIQPFSGKFLGFGGLKKVVEVQVVVGDGGTETEPRALTLM